MPSEFTPAENRAWVGGVISVMGSFSHGRVNAPGRVPKYYMTYQLRRKGEKDSLEKVRRVLGVTNKIRRERTGTNEVWNLRITGSKLEEAIELVWDYLTPDRQKEYLDLDAWIHQQNMEIA